MGDFLDPLRRETRRARWIAGFLQGSPIPVGNLADVADQVDELLAEASLPQVPDAEFLADFLAWAHDELMQAGPPS